MKRGLAFLLFLGLAAGAALAVAWWQQPEWVEAKIGMLRARIERFLEEQEPPEARSPEVLDSLLTRSEYDVRLLRDWVSAGGVTFDPTIDAVEERLAAAREAMKTEDWGRATDQLVQATNTIHRVRTWQRESNRALRARLAAHEIRDIAARARAPMKAKELWEKGESALQTANDHFFRRRFLQARQVFRQAGIHFQRAEERATWRDRLGAAKRAFEAVMATQELALVGQYGGAAGSNLVRELRQPAGTNGLERTVDLYRRAADEWKDLVEAAKQNRQAGHYRDAMGEAERLAAAGKAEAAQRASRDALMAGHTNVAPAFALLAGLAEEDADKGLQAVEWPVGDGVVLHVVYVPADAFDGRSQGLWVGETEVTQAQYERFAWYNPSHFKGADRPVERVSWQDAVEWCEALSAAYGVKARLPAAAEWEAACGKQPAGSLTAYANLCDRDCPYPWRDETGGDGFETTAPVASLKANSYGLYDMLGNVFEWCLDEAEADPVPEGMEAGEEDVRVLRGGCWQFGPDLARCSEGIGYPAGFGNDYIGFRFVLEPGRDLP